MANTVSADITRRDIKKMFMAWKGVIDYSIEREVEGMRTNGDAVTVRYLRQGGAWQSVSCRHGFYAENLRSIFAFLDRLRISESRGIFYQGLSNSKELAPVDVKAKTADDLTDAYDILGVVPEDPMDLIEQIYTKKAMYSRPDKGGDVEKFKRITAAVELIRKARGAKVTPNG